MASGNDVGYPDYRMTYHFSPVKNWINDPCGLIYHRDIYHLFFQYNPSGDGWGNMSWGHATSPDLITWSEHEVALPVTEDGVMAFTGTCILDTDNTTGFGTKDNPPILAFFTGYRSKEERKIQDQRVAYSLDDGFTWTCYENNPIIDIDSTEFRDPDVIWYQKENKWVMSLALAQEKQILFYESKNLLDWSRCGEFGPEGCLTEEWECPNLIHFTLDDDSTKWCLLVSVGGREKGFPPGVQYFIGDFNGDTFTNSNPSDTVLWVDKGFDFYAPQIFTNAPDDRKIVLGWFLSWMYGERTPTSPWRGDMTMPVDLSLVHTTDGLRLHQQPSRELQTVRTGQHTFYKQLTPSQVDQRLHSELLKGNRVEMMISLFDVEPRSKFQLDVFKNTSYKTSITYQDNTITVDRCDSGNVSFCDKFYPQMVTNVIRRESESVILHIFLDRSGIKVFSNPGAPPISARVFSPADADQISVSGEACLVNMDIYALK